MTGVVLVNPRTKFTNSSGVPISGGSVTVYLAGTTTVATTYQDKALTTENTSPITLDANGECLLWVDSANTYKILLADALGATVSGYPVDNVPGAADIGAAATAAAAATATAVEEAEEAAEAAETAQAAAEVAAEQAAAAALIFADTTAGLAAVASGEYFYVPSNVDGETLILYKDNAGVAEEIVRFLSAPELPGGMQVAWPPFSSYPTGWFDTGRRAFGTVDPIISNGTPADALTETGGDCIAWFDNSDLSTLFQDTAGTIPVTADGDPVGYQTDKSGNGLHRVALNGTTARPTWRTSGGYCWLEWDGTSDGMQTATTTLLSGYTHRAIIAAIRKTTSPAAFRAYFESRNGTVGAQAFGIYLPFDATGGMSFTNSGSTFKTATAVPATYPDNVDYVLTGVGDVLSQIALLRVNGAQADINCDNQGTTGHISGERLYWGGRSGSSFYFTGREYQCIVWRGKISPQRVEFFERYMSSKCPASFSVLDPNLPYVHEPTTFQDSAAVDTSSLLFPRVSTFAHADYTTTATEIEVTTFCTLEASYISGAVVGVYVNGVYNTSITLTGRGYATNRVALASGSKTVSLVVGTQSRPNVGSNPEGVFIKRVAANSPLTVSTTTPANRVLFLGDSITAGDSATTRAQNSYALLLRAAVYPRSVAVEAYGFRTFYDECFDAAAITASVARLVAFFSGTTGTQTIVAFLGTNDYGLNKWAAATFGTQVAAWLDAVNAALPSALIKLITPLTRANETVANGSGSTLPNYRTELATAQSTRSGYVSLTSGPSMVTYPTNFAADLLHPNNAGHAQIATAVQALI